MLIQFVSILWILFKNVSTKPKGFCVWQGNSLEFEISKWQKKKDPIVEEEPKVEIVTKVEYTYEDTRCVVGVEPEYKWGEV